MDGFIKSAIWQVMTHDKRGSDAKMISDWQMGIILGVARAVITTNYDITNQDLAAAETAKPKLEAIADAAGEYSYRVLAEEGDPHLSILTSDLALTEEEMTVIKVIGRSAQAVIPVQGHNLLVEGHHYISEPKRPSFKAFFAVEKQIWVAAEMKQWLEAGKDAIRDLMWHKSGHPVAAAKKEAAATSLVVKKNLEMAKMGSAAARLPALESEARCASTYVRLIDAVNPIWNTMGGGIDATVLRNLVDILETNQRGETEISPPYTMGANDSIVMRTRANVVHGIQRVCKMNADTVATAYGFYCTSLDVRLGT